MWNPKVFSVNIKATTAQTMHLEVNDMNMQRTFYITFVYGFNKAKDRENLWNDLKLYANHMNNAWCICGDFNNVLRYDERLGSEITYAEISSFQECVSYCEVMDLPSQGAFFTWTNKQGGEKRVLSKIDRALCNDKWMDMFPKSYAHFLPEGTLDHCPCIIYESSQALVHNTPFKFFNMWTKAPHFLSTVRDTWDSFIPGPPMYRVIKRLKDLKRPLKALNTQLFSDIETKTNIAKAALMEIQVLRQVNPRDGRLQQNETNLAEAYSQLAKAHELYLRQKTKAEWINKGDTNTSYFHNYLRTRRNRNKVHYICDMNNTRCDEPAAVHKAFQEFYENLLGKTTPVIKVHKATLRQGNIVKEEHRKSLLNSPTEAEIKQAIFTIPDTKSPGPDGYSSYFFKYTWGITGKEVCKAIKNFFHTGKLLKQVNATHLTLIPKVDNPISVTQFRPIACCNVLYKAISKILCNRLNMVLPYIISPSQSAFVKNRDIVENVLICQDLVKHYNRKGCSPRAMMKIDLQKAYDSIEWKFIEGVLKALAFPHHFIIMIMQCVTTPSYSINLNGVVAGFFKGQRGLRQGDPISPLLFLLCMEYLSRILKVGQNSQGFRYHPLCRGVKLTHLMFADDLLLFSRGDPHSIRILMKAFNTFSAASGLQMNQNKSNIFIAGVKDCTAQHLVNIAGIKRDTLPFKYLGVPISAKKISNEESHQLVDKIVKRINTLGARKLSYGGRLVLIKAVLSTLHSYWARIFVIPTKTIKDISATCRNYLWQGHEHYTNAPPIAWDTVCQTKERGGLGIIAAQEWNIAALGKYVWWIAQKKDTLWVKWIHATYLKGKEWMEYRPNANSSWVWRKLCMVKEKLKMGYDGTWWQTPGMQYTTKGGYQWLLREKDKVDWKDFVWNRISLPKHAFTSWMIAHNRLRTKDKLPFLNIQDLSCYLCTSHDENIPHLFFKCKVSNDALKSLAKWLDISIPVENVEFWWTNKRLKSLLHKKYIAAALASLRYHIWTARNNSRIHQKVTHYEQIFQYTKKEIQTMLKQDDRIRQSKNTSWANRLLE